MDLGLADRKVLVTGGSAGIGRAMVEAFAAEGATVAFTYFSGHEAALALAAEVGGHAIPMNLRESSSVRAAVATAVAALGRVDVLVNNALLRRQDIVAEQDLAAWQLSLRANLEHQFLVTELLAPPMAERGWGRIVSISSDLAENGSRGGAAYSTAKAGLHGMTRSFAWDFGPQNVLINVIMPGLTSSERQLSNVPEDVFRRVAEGNPTGRISSPEDIADLAVFLCSARNRNITGEFIRVTGGS